MRAIILAAGRGMRLQHAEDQQLPKRLLRFARVSLLERHLQEASEPGFTNSSPQGRWIGLLNVSPQGLIKAPAETSRD
jgi:hypothetical protein